MMKEIARREALQPKAPPDEFTTTTNAEGVLHSKDDKPSVVSASGHLKWWHKDGKMHREGGKAAHIAKYKDRYSWARWCKDGKLHRAGGKPASIQLSPDVCVFRWCYEGKACNEDDGPVLVRVERGDVEAYRRIGSTLVLETLADFEDSDAFGIRAVAKALAGAQSDEEFWREVQAMFEKWIE